MLERANFKNGLTGADDFGEFALRFLAISVDDFNRAAHRSCERMQHHKAGPVGEEVRKRRPFRRKLQCSIALCVDFGGIADRLILVLAGGLVTDSKAILALAEYANWLEKERLPKATAPFARGRCYLLTNMRVLTTSRHCRLAGMKNCRSSRRLRIASS